jgi:hypothetical protein
VFVRNAVKGPRVEAPVLAMATAGGSRPAAAAPTPPADDVPAVVDGEGDASDAPDGPDGAEDGAQ